ncbi:glycosyltransferase family 4 protein [Parafrankia elaeagni]|uniref:glycosyltransferase family 4 protein n=1 Tax=Parafrankia elaeagni TaxID=222534 RepID=UPI000374CA19|nr:glycosyltransferase family 4 protein [Parafrankia elaeagni]
MRRDAATGGVPGRTRILLVTHYFPPEVGAPQARLSETARAWAADGLDVTVLTGMPNHPTGVVPPAYRRALRRVEHADGYRVVRTWLYATPNEGVVRKTLSHLSFMVSSVLLGARIIGRTDVLVVSSPTFFSLGSAWMLARLRRARLVVEVRDLWPAIFVQLGVIRNRRVIAALERLEIAAYRAADAVVTVTEGFRADIVRRGIPATKVHVIPNGVDIARFRPTSPDEHGDLPAVRERLGALPGDLLVLYLGAHGISQGLVSVADAATWLARENIPVHIAFVGEGADKRRLAAHVTRLGLSNVSLHPAVARDEVPALLAAADVCLVPLRDVPLFETFIPSKMFELLAAGRPVIGSVRGEAARILSAAGALVVEPENPELLASAIGTLATSPSRRAEMARTGRSYVAAHYNRVHLARRYRDLVLGLMDVRVPPAQIPRIRQEVPARHANVAGGTSTPAAPQQQTPPPSSYSK